MFFESAFGDGLAEEIFVPLRCHNDSGSGNIVALAQFDNKDIVNMVNVLLLTNDREKLKKFIAKNRNYVFQASITIKGIKQFGIDLSGEERRKINKAYSKIEGDFIVIKEGEKPGYGMAVFLLIGLLLFIYSLVRIIKQ